MSLELNATLREDMGKGASRRLRHANLLPAIIYGAGKDPVSITLLQKDVQHKLPDEHFYSQVMSLVVEGKAEDVLLRDIQHHPYRQEVMHMDFIRVMANEVVNVFSQLHFIGEESSPGVKTENGVISHVMTEVEIECLPRDIPEHIKVDVSEMHVGDIIHLSNLQLPAGVTLVAFKHEISEGEEESDFDLAVATMHARKVELEEDEEAAAPAPEAAKPADEEGSE
jgi:large subunit ribosomal protein L25